MKSRGWIFGLVTLLIMPLVHASLSSQISSLWDTFLYIGGLGFLNLPGTNDLILFLRLAIGLLVFTILFALGVLAGSNQAQFLNRQHAAVIAGVITVITMVFIPSSVLIAISASFGTLVSLILLAAPLVAMVLLVVFLPDEPCGWNAAKVGIAALIMWILNLQQVHLKNLASSSNYIPVNEAIDWAAFIAFIFFVYYLFKWIMCAMGGDDENSGDFNWNDSPLSKIWNKITNGGDGPDNNNNGPSSGGGGSGNNTNTPDYNSNVPTPGTGAAGSLGEETRAMFQVILDKINTLTIDMNKKFTDLEVWLQTLNENVKLNGDQIVKLQAYLETIKNDLITEIRTVVHEEVAVLHKEIKKIRTEMQVIQKQTHVFISSKHKAHIREIRRIEKDLIRRQEKLIQHQEKIIEMIKIITTSIEKLERESVKTETVNILIERIREIKEKIVIIEAERIGISKLDIDAVVQLLRNLELKINIEINNNNDNDNNNNNNNGGNEGGGGNGTSGPRKPRGSAALEFYVNNRRETGSKVTTDLRNAKKFSLITLKNGGTGGYITYHVTYHPMLQVNIENRGKGVLSVGEEMKFSISRINPIPPSYKKKYASIVIRARAGKHQQKEKGWHWFNKNKTWHYEVSMQIQ